MRKKGKISVEGEAYNKMNSAEEFDEKSMGELFQKMNELEEMLGKKKFNRLMGKAMDKFEETGNLWNGDEGLQEVVDDLMDFEPVTATEWSDTHPTNLVCGSDKYYADLANDICSILSEIPLPTSAPDNLIHELGRVLAAYLEDIISETKVFSAMRRVCMARYGYALPFFDCSHPDYMPDHINEEDIRFLIWMTSCRLGRGKNQTFSPLAPGWELMADKVFDELNSRYEEAPESRRVADWLRRSLRKGEYMDIREIAIWLVSRNPLTYIYGFMDELYDMVNEELSEGRYDPKLIDQAAYGYMAMEAWQRSMSAMGCPSRTLVAAIASEFGFDSQAKEIEAIEVFPKQVYAISKEKKKILFEASDHEIIEVHLDSLSKDYRPGDTKYGACTLVKYKGEYLLNGVLVGNDEFEDEWQNQTRFLSFEQMQKEAKEYIEKLDGQQVLCVTDIKKFLKKIDVPANCMNEPEGAKNIVVLISKELGIGLMPDVGYAFDLPGNRFYRKRAAAKDSFAELVFNNSIPHDVAEYIEKHHLLPEASIFTSQGKETGLRIVQDYLAFWIGFYCSLPAYGRAQEY